jgi:hypothetical protein
VGVIDNGSFAEQALEQKRAFEKLRLMNGMRISEANQSATGKVDKFNHIKNAPPLKQPIKRKRPDFTPASSTHSTKENLNSFQQSR